MNSPNGIKTASSSAKKPSPTKTATNSAPKPIASSPIPTCAAATPIALTKTPPCKPPTATSQNSPPKPPTKFAIPHHVSELFHQRILDPRLTDPLQQLHGPNFGTHNSLFIFKAPQVGLGFPWHQDMWYFRKQYKTDYTVGCWQAIDDATIDNGCLWVIPGSHKWDILTHDELEGPQQTEFKKARVPKNKQGIPVVIPKGSVIFFHSNLLHKSTDNLTNTFRRCFVTHVIRGDAEYADNVSDEVRQVLIVNQMHGQTQPGKIHLTPPDQCQAHYHTWLNWRKQH